MNSRDLNSLLGSRICHDLISPLGAIGNGIELLMQTGLSAAPEIALISESVESANVRIRFFRIAFGAAGPTESVPVQDCRTLLTDLSRGDRLRYHWLVSEPMLRRQVKLAFLLLQCLESAMPYGGRIDVTHDGERWTLTGSAERRKLDPDLWAFLENSAAPTEITASNVHFALVGPAAVQAGCRVAATFGDDQIVITF